MSVDTAATRLATRLSFFAAGYGAACWAPLVPYARARLHVDEGLLGLLLLCLGLGSLLVMPATGGLVGRFGSRTVILAGGAGYCLALPVLATTGETAVLAVALLAFGASLGAMDVAMNIHAVAVERASSRPLMSGFHGQFSLGAFAGAGSMTLLLGAGLTPGLAAGGAVLVVIAALAPAVPRYLQTRTGSDAPFFVRPRGLVLLLGALAFVAFLVEGAVLDWSALLLTEYRGFRPEHGGLAYAVFSVAMTVGRLTGDRVVARLGPLTTLVAGGVVTTGGLMIAVVASPVAVMFGGFLLAGLGVANIVPVLFTAAGRQQAMPGGLAIASMTAVGYAGILAGPAAIGFVAEATTLPYALALVSGLVLIVPACARIVAVPRHGE